MVKIYKTWILRPTDQRCYKIWNGYMTREEAVVRLKNYNMSFKKEYFEDLLKFP